MNVLAKIGRFLRARWFSISYVWRRRIVIGAIVWAVFRLLAWYLGFVTLAAYLLIAVVITYVVAELGVRRLIPAYVWFYKQFTGQILGIVFAMLLPVIAESWVRAATERTWENLALAAATTAVILYLWWVIRTAVFSPAEGLRARRLRSRQKERS